MRENEERGKEEDGERGEFGCKGKREEKEEEGKMCGKEGVKDRMMHKGRKMRWKNTKLRKKRERGGGEEDFGYDETREEKEEKLRK